MSQDASKKRVVIVGNDVSAQEAKLLVESGFTVRRVESIESISQVLASQDPASTIASVAEAVSSGDALVQLRVLNDEMLTQVAERKRAEEEVAKARAEAERRAAELESFVWSLGAGVSLFNAQGELVFANDAVRQMIGAPGDAPIQTWGIEVSLLAVDGQPVPIEQYPSHRALRGEMFRDNRYIAKSPWVEALVSIAAAPVCDPQGGIIGATVVWRDIAEQVSFEVKQQELFAREHHIAEVLQQAIIPPEVPAELYGYTIAVKYRPALKEAEIGGDFYDVFDLGDGKFGVLIGDVAGKGLPAAIRVAEARHSIRSYAFIDASPARIMTLANYALCRERSDKDAILTAFFAVVDTEVGAVTYSGAGHEPPIVCTRRGQCDGLPPGGLPLGVMKGAEYTEGSHRIDPGDTIVMVTDGITEARAQGSLFFGSKGVIRYLRRNREASPSEIASGLLDAATAHAGGQLKDDAAIVVIEQSNRKAGNSDD